MKNHNAYVHIPEARREGAARETRIAKQPRPARSQGIDSVLARSADQTNRAAHTATQYRAAQPEAGLRVVLSLRAAGQILAETAHWQHVETGGFLLGHFHHGTWYVVEAVDGGLPEQTHHSAGRFVYDEAYAQHVIARVARAYKTPLRILGMWHRHPGSLDCMSAPDLVVMDEHAQESPEIGFLSAIVNVDPNPRITMYCVSATEKTVCTMPCSVEPDKAFPAAALAPALSAESCLRFAGQAGGAAAVGNAPAATREAPAAASEPPASAAAHAGFPGAGRRVRNEIIVPQELLEAEGFEGVLWGYLNPDTGVHAVLGWGLEEHRPAESLECKPIGFIGNVAALALRGVVYPRGVRGNRNGCVGSAQGACLKTDAHVRGSWVNGALKLVLAQGHSRTPLTLKPYDLVQKLYSRHAGLLEAGYMSKASALICGAGSVGSLVALELARAGVGRIFLCDPDVFEIHNVCRHQLDLRSLGAYKVHGLEKRVRAINPHAQVEVLPCAVQDVPYETAARFLSGNALVVGTGDSPAANAYANDLAASFGKPFVSIGFWKRAGVLHCFRWVPHKGMTRYACAFASALEHERTHAEKSRYYIDETEKAEAAAQVFEPGLGMDIELGTSIGVKVALDLLNAENPDFTQRLVPYFGQSVLFGITHLEAVGGPDAAMLFTNPLQARYNVSFAPCNCPLCTGAETPRMFEAAPVGERMVNANQIAQITAHFSEADFTPVAFGEDGETLIPEMPEAQGPGAALSVPSEPESLSA